MGSVLTVVLLAQCTFAAEWRPEQELLRLDDGTPWATVSVGSCGDWVGPHATVQVAADGGFALDLERDGVRLRSRAAALPVTFDGRLNFGAGFTSGAGTWLTIRSVRGDRVELVPSERSDVDVSATLQPRVVQCRELRLGKAHEVDDDPLPRLTTRLQLQASPNGQKTFMVPRGTLVASARPMAGGTQIVVSLVDGATIAGWTAVAPLPLEEGSWSHIDCIVCGADASRTCAIPLPLFVTRGDRVEAVGELARATPFHVESSDGTWVTVRPWNAFFAVSKNWKLVVRSDVLERCSEVALDWRTIPLVPAHLQR